MDQGLIPRRYAKALYEVATERNQNAQVYAVMQQLSEAFAAQPMLQQTIANPFVANADKLKLINTIVSDSKSLPDIYHDFIKLLERKGRINMVRDIAKAYIEFYCAENHIYKVEIESAATLAQQTRERITTLIENHIGNGKLECSFNINPKLIGGFTIKVGNELLDASVASQLNQLRQELVK